MGDVIYLFTPTTGGTDWVRDRFLEKHKQPYSLMDDVQAENESLKARLIQNERDARTPCAALTAELIDLPAGAQMRGHGKPEIMAARETVGPLRVAEVFEPVTLRDVFKVACQRFCCFIRHRFSQHWFARQTRRGSEQLPFRMAAQPDAHKGNRSPIFPETGSTRPSDDFDPNGSGGGQAA